jgi:ATP-dependent Clp protease ATP-binding subunit ClpB
LREIVGIQLQRVESLLRDRGFSLEVSPEARAYLADVGFDPDFGARPLKRAIQRELQDPLALEVLSGNLKVGDTIRVNTGEKGLTFTPILQGEIVEE